MSNPPQKPPRKPHTLADHLLGAFADHVHDEHGDHDHDHDHDAMDGLLQPGEDGHVTLTSIGIDIGSSGTQIAFSRLSLERAITRRQTLYQSPVSLTPFGNDDAIDEDELGRILDDAFDSAGIHPDDVDCGVVILTGLARERGNAETIARRLAQDCGDIVSASAGHHMEARLAAHGSGAVARSAATGKRFLNVDIGGGTTKLAVCEAGRILATAALEIGGRLATISQQGRISRLTPAAIRHAARAGLAWEPDKAITQADIARVANSMADALLAAVSDAPPPDSLELYLTAPIAGLGPVAGLIVSGGVGEYVYGRETRNFGDLGQALGQAVAARIDAGDFPWPLMPATHCIRATVLGASQYSVQLSGRTGWISDAGALLPRRNLQVLCPDLELSGEFAAGTVAEAIREHLQAFDIAPAASEVAFAFTWRGPPDYDRLRALAEGIAIGLAPRTATGLPIYILIEGDIAQSLGAIISEELKLAVDLLVLDGVRLADFDYVDLGRIRLPSGTVPVTIKTLVFRPEQVQKRSRKRLRGT